jgi:haloacetate dehalogenase
MAAEASPGYYPWFLLAQPAPFPERLIGASADYFLTHTLDDWTAIGGAIEDEAFARYLATFTPDTISAMCSDYRAAFHLDRPLEAEDRAAGRRIACPVLVHWGSEDMTDSPLGVWRRWADDVRGGPLRSGHFLPEEAPDELVASLRDFL